MLFEQSYLTLALFVLALGCVYITSSYWRLRHIPGPLLAKLTDLWRLFLVYRRRPEETQLRLHRQYGDLVRLGPNCVSVSGPDTTLNIYGIGKGFIKASQSNHISSSDLAR